MKRIGDLWRTLERRAMTDVACGAETGEAYGGVNGRVTGYGSREIEGEKK
jgi:hypothetical protein